MKPSKGRIVLYGKYELAAVVTGIYSEGTLVDLFVFPTPEKPAGEVVKTTSEWAWPPRV